MGPHISVRCDGVIVANDVSTKFKCSAIFFLLLELLKWIENKGDENNKIHTDRLSHWRRIGVGKAHKWGVPEQKIFTARRGRSPEPFGRQFAHKS
jgi:hypothetical protein